LIRRKMQIAQQPTVSILLAAHLFQ